MRQPDLSVWAMHLSIFMGWYVDYRVHGGLEKGKGMGGDMEKDRGKTRQVELLAPAGSYESMKAAFAAGADAVYIGGSRFGARAYADNLEEERMCQAIDYAHIHGRRLYMTVNTLFKERELKELYRYLEPYYRRGLDGVIVQDLGAMAFMGESFPGLPLHASTQMTIVGPEGARKLKEMGASRIVTARELSLEEIRQIKSQVDIEIESFVHGALCYCYSGQCLMSSLIGGRSGNRGRCAQPCRLPYTVPDRYRAGDNKRPDKQYILNLKDLCTLDILPQIIEAGVCSLKIEGRMKSPRYTAGVVSIYRRYVDRYLDQGGRDWQVDPADKRLLLDLFDRGGFTEGYYAQHNGRDMVALGEKPAFRKENQAFSSHLDQAYIEKELQEPIKGAALLEPGKEASLTLWRVGGAGEERAVTVYGQKVQEAVSQPMSREKVEKQLRKTGNSPFSLTSLEVSISGDIFMPVQALNELRRMGLEALEKAILEAAIADKRRTDAPNVEIKTSKVVQANDDSKRLTGQAAAPMLLAASLEEREQLAPALADPDVDEIYIDADGYPAGCWADVVDACHQAGKKCRLLLPAIFRQQAVRYFNAEKDGLFKAGFDGTVVRDLEGLGWLKKLEREVIGGTKGARPPLFSMVFDHSLYTWNHLADRVFLEEGPERITMPVELNSHELLEKGCAGQELIVYGALPMMVSAQCVQKTMGGCIRERGDLRACGDGAAAAERCGGKTARSQTRRVLAPKPQAGKVLTIKDRTGKEMPVKSHCTFCYSTIYNASPLMLLGMEEVVRKLRPSVLRLQFTTEPPGQVRRCLQAYAESFRVGLQADPPCKEFTRGHMKRGVE